MAYIGVTGFLDAAEVDVALGRIPENCSHKLMVGVLAAGPTVTGKWKSHCPPQESIKDIFSSHPSALNLVHYATKATGMEAADEWCIIRELAGPNCHGLQLNGVVPTTKMMEWYRSVPGNENDVIVLQVGQFLLNHLIARSTEENPITELNLPVKLPLILVPLVNAGLNAVLFDMSAGHGEPVDIPKAIQYVTHLKSLFENTLEIGVAGGLSATYLAPIKQIWRVAELNWDAEGALRFPAPSNRLDMDAVCAYLDKSVWIAKIAATRNGC